MPVMKDGKPFKTDQTNNSYIFPGVGPGVLASKATRVTDPMFGAAVRALASVSAREVGRVAARSSRP